MSMIRKRKKTRETKTAKIKVPKRLFEGCVDVTFEQKGGIIASIYSHKGGVGKTTMVLNISKILINDDAKIKTNIKRVLLLDLDSQMSLTTFILSDEKLNAHMDSVLDDMEVAQNEDKKREHKFSNDNWHGVYTNYSMSENNKVIIEPMTWFSKNDKRVDLLKGSLGIPSLERSLGQEISEKRLTLQNKFIKNFLQECKNNYDLILIDLDPSLSSLNTLVIANSDHLVCPINLDLFSRKGFRSMKVNILKTLNQDFIKSKIMQTGFIINRCRIRNGVLTAESERTLAYINDEIKNNGLDFPYLGQLTDLASLSLELHRKHETVTDRFNKLEQNCNIVKLAGGHKRQRIQIAYLELRNIVINLLVRFKCYQDPDFNAEVVASDEEEELNNSKDEEATKESESDDEKEGESESESHSDYDPDDGD
jgi:cellulose biosynthesis protein BcsQ